MLFQTRYFKNQWQQNNCEILSHVLSVFYSNNSVVTVWSLPPGRDVTWLRQRKNVAFLASKILIPEGDTEDSSGEKVLGVNKSSPRTSSGEHVGWDAGGGNKIRGASGPGKEQLYSRGTEWRGTRTIPAKGYHERLDQCPGTRWDSET